MTIICSKIELKHKLLPILRNNFLKSEIYLETDILKNKFVIIISESYKLINIFLNLVY